MSTVVVMVAANLVIESMEWRSKIGELRRKRTEWNLARRFVEAEITSGTRVITDVDALEIPEECGIENDEFTHAIEFPLERPIRVQAETSPQENFKVVPPAIYGVQNIEDGSVINGRALVRCGPRINHDNNYGGFYESELCADGKDSNCREVILDNWAVEMTAKMALCQCRGLPNRRTRTPSSLFLTIQWPQYATQ